jgi:hypothetical protein
LAIAIIANTGVELTPVGDFSNSPNRILMRIMGIHTAIMGRSSRNYQMTTGGITHVQAVWSVAIISRSKHTFQMGTISS